jgi:hypothetical protein
VGIVIGVLSIVSGGVWYFLARWADRRALAAGLHLPGLEGARTRGQSGRDTTGNGDLVARGGGNTGGSSRDDAEEDGARVDAGGGYDRREC